MDAASAPPPLVPPLLHMHACFHVPVPPARPLIIRDALTSEFIRLPFAQLLFFLFFSFWRLTDLGDRVFFFFLRLQLRNLRVGSGGSTRSRAATEYLTADVNDGSAFSSVSSRLSALLFFPSSSSSFHPAEAITGVPAGSVFLLESSFPAAPPPPRPPGPCGIPQLGEILSGT